MNRKPSRRVFTRSRFSQPVQVDVPVNSQNNDGIAVSGELLDFSASGVRFLSDTRLSPGTKLTVSFQPEGLQLAIRIVWSEKQHYDAVGEKLNFVHGAVFTEQRSSASLEDFLKSLSPGKHGPVTERRKNLYFDLLIDELKQQGIHLLPPVFETAATPEVRIDGRQVISLGSNNSLGLSTHEKVLTAAQYALSQFGTTCGGSRLVSGNHAIQNELEHEVAGFMNAEECNSLHDRIYGEPRDSPNSN